MGIDQADTMLWLKALLHPLVGAIFSPATTQQTAAKTTENRSPHKRNSLNPTELAAALSEDEVSLPHLIRNNSSKSDSKAPDAVILEGEEGTIADPSSYNYDEPVVEPASKLDRVLLNADSALQEAALLAEGWRYSEEDAARLSEVEQMGGEENLKTIDA